MDNISDVTIFTITVAILVQSEELNTTLHCPLKNLSTMVWPAAEAFAAAVATLLWHTFLAAWPRLSGAIWRFLDSREQRWRCCPGGGVEELLADLRPATRSAYLKALRRFHDWSAETQTPTGSLYDLDCAIYRYMPTCTRSAAETLMSALGRAYPLTRGHLAWSTARMKVIASARPHVHHEPMPWLVAVDIAYTMHCMGYPRRAAQLLLAWRFGLRPSEFVALRGGDLYSRLRHQWAAAASFLRLGTGPRGTKAGRPQIVRAYPGDAAASWLIDSFAFSTPPNSHLSDIHTFQGFSRFFRVAADRTGYVGRYSLHCARAGWASWRYAAGQPFADLQEDGRWRSPAALRVYLDVVAAVDTFADPDIGRRLPYMQSLEASLPRWLIFF